MQTSLSIVGKASKRPKEASAAELALDRYDLLVADFYEKYRTTPSKSETKAQRDKRLIAEARDLKFLKLKRIELIAHARVEDLEDKLESYTSENLQKNASDLLREKHHPTGRLAGNLTAAGEPQPTQNHEPHHIIPGEGRFRKADMRAARLNMHLHRVGINDPRNGVWLMNFLSNATYNWADLQSPAHRSLHRYNYETWISAKFARTTVEKKHFEARLFQVKMHLKKGTYPEKVMGSKDNSWTG
ncbi:hypothetical protein SN11_25175 [Vibrio harveyi]|nr:hypothetical protein SN11_25175 [Vibrio harveyi]